MERFDTRLQTPEDIINKTEDKSEHHVKKYSR